MARTGGSATFSGVAYQALYTAFRFAEAITEEGILSICPEAHHEVRPVLDGNQIPVFIPQKPAVDDLLIIHQSKPLEYVSLKYRDSVGSWTARQLRDRGILTDFLAQHQQHPTARLRVVTQTSADQALSDCLERLKTTTLTLLEYDLGAEPFRVFTTLEGYLQSEAGGAITRTEVLQLLQQVEIETAPAQWLTKVLLLTLQPQTHDARAALNVLVQLAYHAASTQTQLTPDAIRQELTQQGQPLILPLAAAEVMAELKQASSTLTNITATIGQLPAAFHINRPEVQALLDWVLSPLPDLENNQPDTAAKTRVIIGGAGIGKTVLLRDVCLALQAYHLPVLGLKADRTKGESKPALLHAIQQDGLRFPLQQALATVATAERPAVIIIDQLDALSMCLSGNHDWLTSYTELIAELCQLPHVRLILSCRTFDLRHDPDLAALRHAPQVEIPLLSLPQVAEALQAVGIPTGLTGLPASLQTLLQVPLHLALYCELDPTARSSMAITSVQGLYKCLLDGHLVNRKRLPDSIDAQRVKRYLAAMAREMYEAQNLTRKKYLCEEEDPDVFDYLCSRGVLIETGPEKQQVAFFHQTFYEYLFARDFVQSGQPLADFVLQSGQGLFFRSLIQQVLGYLRSVDVAAYYLAIRQLLSADRCRKHVRLLLTQYVASQAAPTAEEQRIASNIFLADSLLLPAFLEAVSARPWLEWLLEPTQFQRLMPVLIPVADSQIEHVLFWRLSRFAPDLALTQVAHLPASEHKEEWIVKVLHSIEEYTHPLFISLFEQVFANEVPVGQQFTYWHILKDAAPTHPQWVAEKTYQQLAHWPNKYSASGQHEDYLQAEVFKAIYQAVPAVCLEVSCRLLRAWIKQANYYREPLFVDSRSKYELLPPPHFLDTLDRKELKTAGPHNAPEAVYYYVHKGLVASASQPNSPHQQLIAKWLHSRTKTLVQLALAAVASRPASFTDAAVRLFTKPGWLAAAAYRGTTGYHSLSVFPGIWDAATPRQRTQLATALSSPSMLIDVDIYDDGGHRRVCHRFGRAAYRFLLALTPARLTNFPELLQLYQQLARRWGDIPNTAPGPLVRITSGDPSPAQKWKVAVIPPGNWLKALRKYRNKTRSFWDEGGTYTGLCSQLSTLVKQDPIAWQPTLQFLLTQRDESLSKLLPSLHEVAPSLAEPLIVQAVQANLLTAEEVRQMRHWQVNEHGSHMEARPEDVRADLAHILAHLDAGSSVSGEKIDLLVSAINTPGGRTMHNLLKQKLSVEDAARVSGNTIRSSKNWLATAPCSITLLPGYDT